MARQGYRLAFQLTGFARKVPEQTTSSLPGELQTLSQRFSTAAPKVGRLNHVAIAVPDLQKAADRYRAVLGAQVSDVQDLPEHGVSVVFVELANAKFELLHPLGDDSPISGFLRKNPAGGLHHVCLEVPDVKASMKHVASSGIRCLADEPKIGAHGNPVVFLHPKDNDGVLTELEQVSRQ